METFYFGTSLERPGHYYFNISNDGQRLYSSTMKRHNIPFEPEQTTKGLPNGQTRFIKCGNYSIVAIPGSCIDRRPGSKTVFFWKEDLSVYDMIQRIKSLSIAMKIIEKMPFKVLYFTS